MQARVCGRKRRKIIRARVVSRYRARGVRLELFVSEAAANLSKNMFDPFNPYTSPHRWRVDLPCTGCGTAQTVNRIFIILRRWHFPVIFSFYDHFSSLALRYICIILSPYSAEKKKKKPTHTALSRHTHAHTHTHKSPLASFLTCKMTWKLNPPRPWVTILSAHTQSFFFFFIIFIVRFWRMYYDLTAPRRRCLLIISFHRYSWL